MELLLIPTFALLNRWRGSDFPRPWCAFIAKILSGLLLGYLLGGAWWMYPLMVVMYLLGEAWIDFFKVGWGEHVGAIVEGREYLSNVARLAARGAMWWACCLLPFVFMGAPVFNVLVGIVIIGIAFPISFLIARQFPCYNWFGHSYTENYWKIGEIIYGAIQGAATYIWII